MLEPALSVPYVQFYVAGISMLLVIAEGVLSGGGQR